jgi:hypothetical protein
MSSPPLPPLANVDILSYIFSFVGPDHYLCLAPVNRRFQSAYSNTFPGNYRTGLMASTVDLARMCWNELDTDDSSSEQQELCRSAAAHGNLQALQWLRSVGCTWWTSTCAAAAGQGQFTVLQWCRANGAPWDETTCTAAARAGHLSILQWCRANGAPWDVCTCAMAAANGHLDVLMWCRQNGCPWSEWTYMAATENGHWNVVEWCRANGCPQPATLEVTSGANDVEP